MVIGIDLESFCKVFANVSNMHMIQASMHKQSIRWGVSLQDMGRTGDKVGNDAAAGPRAVIGLHTAPAMLKIEKRNRKVINTSPITTLLLSNPHGPLANVVGQIRLPAGYSALALWIGNYYWKSPPIRPKNCVSENY